MTRPSLTFCLVAHDVALGLAPRLRGVTTRLRRRLIVSRNTSSAGRAADQLAGSNRCEGGVARVPVGKIGEARNPARQTSRACAD